jgi:predicted naringenin-chalcone synthase
MRWLRSLGFRRIERIDLFHLGCPAVPVGVRQVRRYVRRPDRTDEVILSQAFLVCEGCGARLHADIWPLQTVDPAMWDGGKK